MKLTLIIVGLTFLMCIPSRAQTYDYPSPVSSSLSLTGANDTTAWAHFANPAGIGYGKYPVAGVGYHNAFQTEALSSRSFFAVIPGKLINVAGGYVYFGNEFYNIQNLSLTLARKLSPKLYIGSRFDYVFRYIRGADTRGSLLVDAGFRYSLSDRLAVGVMAYNPGKAVLSDEFTEQPLASSLAVSLGIRLSPSFSLTSGLLHRSDIQKQIYSFGLGALVHDVIEMRGAVSAKPVKLAVGAAFRWSGLEFQLSVNHHDHLGVSSTAGIAYSLGRRKGGDH
jgi:hypothetical protein